MLNAPVPTTARCLEARAAVDRHGPCRVPDGDRSSLLPRRSSSCSMRRTPTRRCGRPAWPSRGDNRSGSSCAPWSTSLSWCPWCRFWIFLCHRRWNGWRISWCSGTRRHLSSRLSQCPRSPMTVSSRCDLRRPQMAEQLVEVPTVLSYALLKQQTAEQIIDIPVPRRRRGQGGLQVFLPEQSCFAFGGADHRIDSPVRGRSGHGGLQGSHPGQSSTSFSGALNTKFKVFAQD